jgi:hypothetical protein
MKTTTPPELAERHDFVFRAADRMRIDGCANAIAREGLSLALHSEHEALLDHCLDLVLSELRRQAPEHRIEVYFPAHTDALLDRFNEVLAAQSVRQAVKSQPNAQALIWVVHDAHRLPSSEIQLLARLIQNFPGANIRAILLMTGQPPQASTLSAFGRKILRWDIETPSLTQAQAALELAQNEGRSMPVRQLLKRMDLDAHLPTLIVPAAAEQAAATHTRSTTPLSAAIQQRVLQFHQFGRNALQNGNQKIQGQVHRFGIAKRGLVLGFFTAMCLSMITLVWLQGDAFGLPGLWDSLLHTSPFNPGAKGPAR